jgi:hypothetical protein
MSSKERTEKTEADVLTCTSCGNEVREERRTCHVCGFDVGYPNVRAATRKEEVQAVERRYRDSLKDAEDRDCSDVVKQFESVVSNSKAVLCKPISKVHEIVSSDNELLSTFHNLVDGLSRLPEKNKWDRGRQSWEASLFPYYFKEIHYAALSLNGSGVAGYGGATLVLTEAMIGHRATVLEENSALFFQRKKVITGDPAPPGYRATWENRGQLAVAKLANKIDSDTQNDDFAEILLESSEKTDCEFIEVHIFGSLHRRTIDRITMKAPRKKADKVLVESIRRKIEEVGSRLEIL